MTTDAPAKAEHEERELERLSKDLKDQVRMAKDRLSDRYAKLMEHRTFEDEGEG